MVQERGRLMVEPGDAIYVGMIVGENARENDIPVNPCKAKKPDQHAFARRRQRHSARRRRSSCRLERALEYIGSDEYVEATPKNLRLRKKILDENQRKRSEKSRSIKLVEVQLTGDSKLSINGLRSSAAHFAFWGLLPR